MPPRLAGHDIVIVGGGAAGCVLASRLSEDPRLRVALVEAGPDAPPGAEHPDIVDPYPRAMGNPRFWWPGLVAETGLPGQRGPRPFIQGHGLGGGSSINGMIAYRGQPHEFARWRDYGVEEWGWDDVLPWFRKLESDRDFVGPLHGHEGPMPVRRLPPGEWAPFSKAMGEAALRRGFSFIADCHAGPGDGLHAVPMNALPDRRVSTSMAYLGPEVRRRGNLTILCGTRVDRIKIVDRDARAVIAQTPSGRMRLEAGRIVVACGAIGSPALLLRSGIGAADALRDLGIAPVHDVRGVGGNLRNRPKVDLAVHLPRASMQARAQRGLAQNCLRISSGTEGGTAHDIGIKFVNRTAWHALGRRIGAVSVGLYQPWSSGSVTLASPDPAISPAVRFEALSDPRDLERLIVGARLALDLLSDPQVAAGRHEAFVPPGAVAARLARPSWPHGLAATAIATALDIGWLRRRLIATLDTRRLLREPDALAGFVRANAALGWHVCGTCRMGRADDPDAVVDTRGAVHGLAGLSVIDASLFPTPVGEGGMLLPVIMAAERLSATIRRDLRSA